MGLGDNCSDAAASSCTLRSTDGRNVALLLPALFMQTWTSYISVPSEKLDFWMVRSRSWSWSWSIPTSAEVYRAET